MHLRLASESVLFFLPFSLLPWQGLFLGYVLLRVALQGSAKGVMAVAIPAPLLAAVALPSPLPVSVILIDFRLFSFLAAISAPASTSSPSPSIPYYRDKYGYQPEDFPITYRKYQRILSLPIYPRMTDADVEDVIGAVREVVGQYRR